MPNSGSFSGAYRAHAVSGACRIEQLAAEQRATLGGTPVELAELGWAGVSAEHRLSLTFDDLSLLAFDLNLRYRRGTQNLDETLRVERSTRTANRGRYLFTLLDDPRAVLTGVELELPENSAGTVTAQLCY